MQSFKKILVPIDLSEASQNVVSMATNLARANESTLIFCYVALPLLPEEAMHSKADMDALILQQHATFKQIRPTDLAVNYEHLFLRGNPAPEIVKAADEQNADLIVLSTHGRTGLSRWLMGSVAEYVVRNAACPVMTIKLPNQKPTQQTSESQPGTETANNTRSPFVTSAMQHVDPIHHYDRMDDVAAELRASNCTAAPVINEQFECIGILTETDIGKYRDLVKRLDEHDETVLDEVYETDKYGMRKLDDPEFRQVQRHMTSPVICVSADTSCGDAARKFEQQPDIHHLIVVDPQHRPIGFVTPDDLQQLASWNLDDSIALNK